MCLFDVRNCVLTYKQHNNGVLIRFFLNRYLKSVKVLTKVYSLKVLYIFILYNYLLKYLLKHFFMASRSSIIVDQMLLC